VLVEGAALGLGSERESRRHRNMVCTRAGVTRRDDRDIDRGGVIASLLATKDTSRCRGCATIAGFIVKKFRGISRLPRCGWRPSRGHTGWHRSFSFRFEAAHDACGRRARTPASPTTRRIAPCLIVVSLYPRISNFDDFDPLRLEPASILFSAAGEPIHGDAALVVLPGSKATSADLARCANRMGQPTPRRMCVAEAQSVLGVCGGYR